MPTLDATQSPRWASRPHTAIFRTQNNEGLFRAPKGLAASPGTGLRGLCAALASDRGGRRRQGDDLAVISSDLAGSISWKFCFVGPYMRDPIALGSYWVPPISGSSHLALGSGRLGRPGLNNCQQYGLRILIPLLYHLPQVHTSK